VNSLIKDPSKIDNFGGNNEIQLCPVHLVETIAEGYVFESGVEPVTFKEGGQWWKCQSTMETIGLDLIGNQTSAGHIRTVSIKGFYPSDDQVSAAIIDEWAQYLYFILKVRDNQGKTRLVGTKDNPMEFDYSSGTKMQVRHIPGYDLSFKAILINRIPFCLP
jgi:hypothetical protein